MRQDKANKMSHRQRTSFATGEEHATKQKLREPDEWKVVCS